MHGIGDPSAILSPRDPPCRARPRPAGRAGGVPGRCHGRSDDGRRRDRRAGGHGRRRRATWSTRRPDWPTTSASTTPSPPAGVVEGPTTTEDGGLTVTLRHPVTSAEEATNLLASLGPPFAEHAPRTDHVGGRRGHDGRAVRSVDAAGRLRLLRRLRPRRRGRWQPVRRRPRGGRGDACRDRCRWCSEPTCPGRWRRRPDARTTTPLVWEAPLDGTATAVTARTVQRPSSGGWAGVVSTIALVLLVLWIVASAAFIVSVARARSRRARARRRRLARERV